MKKIIFLFIVSLFTFSCQEVIDIDLEDGETRLVIDAYFNVSNDEVTNTFLSTDGGVQLSLSAPYFDTEVPTVSNATVYITNLNDNSILNFIESETTGFFIPDTGIDFQPFSDTEYELTVIYNGETYVSTTELIPTNPIDKLEQGDGTLFEGTEKEVVIYYKDDATRDNFYLFDLDFNLYLQSEDAFYQGQDFNFSYFYSEDELIENDITIQIFGVDETYYNYFNLVLDQSQESGNPFQTVPALVKGNITNNTNKDNYPLGYFRISETYSANITIQDEI